MSEEKFDLQWNDFGQYAERTIRNLADDSQFTDVTLISDDKRRIKAHKVILCSSSIFFNEILSETPTDHPMLFLKGINHSELQAIVKFMYIGTTEVSQKDLSKFMKAAAELQIEGLQENKMAEGSQEHSNQKTTKYQALGHGEDYSYSGSGARQEEFDLAPYQESTLNDFKVGNLERNADGKFSCDECDYNTNKTWNLEVHKSAKHEGRKFRCDQCHQVFSQKSNLNRHAKLKHEGNK